MNACDDYFQGLAASFSPSLTGVIVDSTSLSFSTTSENTPLTGNGLQLGYNFEKFRVSLNSHLWSAGESKLDSQLLLLDYFLPYGLYAGGGFGTAKLDTSIGSASKTAPAIHFGYQHNFTNYFSLEAGLLWFGASFSLEKSAAAPEATISTYFLACPDSPGLYWCMSSKSNNAKKNSKVVVIFAVIFFIAFEACFLYGCFFYGRNIFHNCYVF